MTNCSTGNTRKLGWNDSGKPTFIFGLLGFAIAQPNLQLSGDVPTERLYERRGNIYS